MAEHAPKFAKTYCSQCGGEFGPGDNGYSHCIDHIRAAAPDMLEALRKLANEVMGSMPLMEPLARREMGNTNYGILIQRAEEARAAIAKATGEDQATAESGRGR